MRIVIDMQSMQTESRLRGIGRYSFSLVKAMLDQARDIDFWILLNDQDANGIIRVRELFAGLIAPEKVLSFAAPHDVNEAFKKNHWRVKAAELIRSHFLSEMSPDIVLTTSLFEFDAVVSIEPPARRHYQTVVILYDLIPLSEPDVYLYDPIVSKWYDRKIESLLNADLLLAISDYSMRDGITRLKLDQKHCINISAAADSKFTTGDICSKDAVYKNSVLYAGGFDVRKNVDKLIEAYSRLPYAARKSYPLVLAGNIRDVDKRNLIRIAKKLKLGDNELNFAGYIPDELLVDLYRACRLFVFPSRSEGFGLPPLEAMQCGAAVIAAARTSLVEVVETPDALFDPDDIPAMATLLNKGLTDDKFRTRLIANSAIQSKKFSWTMTAQKALNAITSMFTHDDVGRQFVKMIKTPGIESNSYSELIASIGAIQTDSLPAESDIVIAAKSISGNIDFMCNHFAREDQTIKTNDLLFDKNVLSFGRMETPYVFSSTLCREQHFRMPLFKYWCDMFRETPRFHRKQWEFVFICQTLFERGFLVPGKRAVGFGVGREPLVSLFASRGVMVLASDLEIESASRLGWASTNQHSNDKSDLNQRGICSQDDFNRLVTFKNIDMNNIPVDIGSFDFCWSSCAFEHLGSIRRGLDFVRNSTHLMNSGGIAVHTTEFNLSSNDRTLDNNESFVIFRRQDIELLASELRAENFVVETIDYSPGSDPLEQYIDLPPYQENPHLRLQLAGEYTCTSIGLIIRKP